MKKRHLLWYKLEPRKIGAFSGTNDWLVSTAWSFNGIRGHLSA